MIAPRVAARSRVAEVEPDEGVAELYRLLGETTVIWNQCEGRLRRLVVQLAGGKTPEDFAVSARTPVAGLLEILATLAQYAEEEARGHLTHYGACVARLHEHYVFLTRGADYVGQGGTIPGARVWVSRLTGQNRLQVRHERLEAEPLRAVVADLARVSSYGELLLVSLFSGDSPARAARRGWPKPPPLPDCLGKAAPVLVGEPPGQGLTLHATSALGDGPPRLRPRLI